MIEMPEYLRVSWATTDQRNTTDRWIGAAKVEDYRQRHAIPTSGSLRARMRLFTNPSRGNPLRGARQLAADWMELKMGPTYFGSVSCGIN